MSETPVKKRRRKLLQGTVVSDKMNKTRVIKVANSRKHDKYLKVVRSAVKYKAHDEKNESKEGDVVRIIETRPLSKDKRWTILDIVKSE